MCALVTDVFINVCSIEYNREQICSLWSRIYWFRQLIEAEAILSMPKEQSTSQLMGYSCSNLKSYSSRCNWPERDQLRPCWWIMNNGIPSRWLFVNCGSNWMKRIKAIKLCISSKYVTFIEDKYWILLGLNLYILICMHGFHWWE